MEVSLAGPLMAHAHIAIAVGERGAPEPGRITCDQGNSYKQTAPTGLQLSPPHLSPCLDDVGAKLGGGEGRSKVIKHRDGV